MPATKVLQSFVVIVLIAFGPKGSEACDSSICCCVTSGTVTQVANKLEVVVDVYGRCTNGVVTVSNLCTVYSNTVCVDDLNNPDFAIYKSGTTAHVVRDFDYDDCDAQFGCQSGSCATASAGWEGTYRVTTDIPSLARNCDPEQCCCAKSVSASGSGSDLTLSITPTANSTRCPYGDRSFDVDCNVLGNLYLVCRDSLTGFQILMKKKSLNEGTNYVFVNNDACNAVFECESEDCMNSGFAGQYQSVKQADNGGGFKTASKFVIAVALTAVSIIWGSY
ncbi:uncharacterized protein LOC134176118 [Corticium candelabrum]|uniref:uncharacterized protein LOC134176118 n=1 Tax=Corticium candelabrum TaxID=121492 RepID=UPI002E259BAA|nr:uncharacterized protein LOC134176118 [Corticium candelabrum]